ncbi:MAG: exodeoxyribonuclease VII large subunit, partial [Verrucomicrobiota bacterium]
RGRYQIICRQVEEAGIGSLQEAFEKLKAKLAAEGLFDPERKKTLPLLPRRVGIVTSPSGAAIQDMLNIVNRRFPNLHILVAPTRVQGEGAAEEIAEGIRRLNRFGGVDVMIVGRGGGSVEDLWAFNEEVVARAVAASEVPVISAVGHETDFTICDFVADVRAETPSAAVELLIGPKEAFEQGLREYSRRLRRECRYALQQVQQRVDEAGNRLVHLSERRVSRFQHLLRQLQTRLSGLSPQSRLKNHMQQIERFRGLLASRMQEAFRRDDRRVRELRLHLNHAAETRVQHLSQELKRYQSQLRALSPHQVLHRGYSITRTSEGRVITDAEEVQAGDRIESVLAKGTLISNVEGHQEGA